jgi:tetratricopeptide (TPR) repeat protein
MAEQKQKQKKQPTEEECNEAAQLVLAGEELFAAGSMLEAAQRFLKAVELDPRSVRGWNDLGVALHGVGETREAMTAFRTALGIDPDNADAASNMASLQAELGDDEEEETSVGPVEPWPLATQARVRLLAWPDYSDASELDALLGTFGRAISGKADVCLCLRLDPVLDGSAMEATGQLREAHERTLGDAGDLEILLVAESMTRLDWTRLARSVSAVIALPSLTEGRRAEFQALTRLPVVDTLEALEALL